MSHSQREPKVPQPSQRTFLWCKFSYGHNTKKDTLVKIKINSSSASCYFPQLSPTNYFCYQQERFNLSGVIYITISSAHASLGGNSTKDPLRNCCWEKEQGTQNMHLSEHHSQALVAESDATSCADLQNLWFQDKKPHLYLQILSRYLSSYLGRMTPLSLSVWRPGSCRFSGTLEDENK